MRRRVDMTLHPDEDMVNAYWPRPYAVAHYRATGEGAMRLIHRALDGRKPRRILDLPCGYGRVLRHLRAQFPRAEIAACEIDPEKVRFCERQFGAVSIVSSTDFASLDLGPPYNLIWCGSLLTHLPERSFSEALSLFSRSLAPNGIALVTVQGRYASTFQRTVQGYLPHDLFAQVEDDANKTGFGYADYVGEKGYGISMSLPSYVLGRLEEDTSVTVRGYIERGWDDHQDVVIVEKAPIDHPRRRFRRRTLLRS